MAQPPPIPANQQTLADNSHLQTLSVLHYVLGGFGLLGIVFLIIHFAFMATIFTMAAKSPTPTPTVTAYPSSETQETTDFPDAADESAVLTVASSTTTTTPVTIPTPFPKEAAWIVVVFYVFFGLLIVAFGVGNVLSGIWIKKRKNRTFSFVVAAMNCIQFPFGTALGVFTFIVLLRPSVETAYMANRES